jgi:hypothetical protein
MYCAVCIVQARVVVLYLYKQGRYARAHLLKASEAVTHLETVVFMLMALVPATQGEQHNGDSPAQRDEVYFKVKAALS